jgi:hypothetical protein
VLDVTVVPDDHFMPRSALFLVFFKRRVEARRPHFLVPKSLVDLVDTLPVSIAVVSGEATAWSPEILKVGTKSLKLGIDMAKAH